MENNPSTTYCGIRETTHPSLSPSRTLYSRVYRVFASASERLTQPAMDLVKFHLMSGFFLLFFYFCKHETHRSRGRHHLRGSFRESGCASHARCPVLCDPAGLRRLQRRLGIPGRQNGARRPRAQTSTSAESRAQSQRSCRTLSTERSSQVRSPDSRILRQSQTMH